MTDDFTPRLDKPLLLERHGAVATLRFNRPAAMNALDVPTAQAFLEAVTLIAGDSGVRAVVLCGAGKAFVAGGDLATLREDPVKGAADLLGPLHEALNILGTIDAPVIAQVHGAAAGAGLSLMLQADFVIAAEGTRFNLAYINLGASCDVGASWALPRLVGLRRALEIAMLGETVQAPEALQMGLVNKLVPLDALAAEVDTLAQRLAVGPTRAYGHMRRLVRGSFDRTMAQQLVAEEKAFADCAATSDIRAGIEAFYARKPAQFTGH